MSRRHALTDEKRAEIWSQYVKRVPQTTIAHRVGCNRNTVSAVIRCITRELAEGRLNQLDATRAEALAVYDQIQRGAWERLDVCDPTGTASVGYLGVIMESRRRQDRLLGLEQLTVNHTGIYLARIDALMNQPVPLFLEGKTSNEHDDSEN